MKILMVNKFFYIKGGSETYYFNLKKLLERNGHTVIDFSMNDEKNLSSKYSNYFIKNIDYNKKMNIFKKIKLGIKVIYSIEAKIKFKKLINDTKPDIIHLNIFQSQISSSIINVAVKSGIPIVYTAHDLKALCPNYKMMDNNLNICEMCKNNNYKNCISKKCVKNSTLKSFIAYLDAKYNMYNKTYFKINHIITPSLFYKNKFEEYGFDSKKISHIPNFIEHNYIKFNDETNDLDNYYLYFGRLSSEKGIMTLIDAVSQLDLNLWIVGTGPLYDYIKNEIKDKKNIRLLGFKSGKELYSIVKNSKCVVLPSEWYENGPYSAIESLYLKKPIIGANIGGIPELIDVNKNGYIFESGNVSSLMIAMKKIEKLSKKDLESYGENSYFKYLKNYSEKKYYEKLIKIYNELLKK